MDHIHPGDRIAATIVDIMGKVVTRTPHLQKTQIAVSDLTSGMYYFFRLSQSESNFDRKTHYSINLIPTPFINGQIELGK